MKKAGFEKGTYSHETVHAGFPDILGLAVQPLKISYFGMKATLKSLKWLSLMVTLALALSACQKEEEVISDNPTLKSTVVIPDDLCGDETFPILAGQNMEAGLVTIQKNDDFIYVSIETTGGWRFQLSHLHVATSPDQIPQTKQGAAIPGQFMIQTTHTPAVSTFRYQLPNNYELGQTIYIALHLDAILMDKAGVPIQEETAWAGSTEAPSSRWWYYISYTIPECIEETECFQDEATWAGTLQEVTPWFAIIILDQYQTAKMQPLWTSLNTSAGTVYVRPDALNPGMLKITVRLAEDVCLQDGIINWFIQGYTQAPTSRPDSETFEYQGSEHWREFQKRIPAADVAFVAVQIKVKVPVECP